LTADVRTRPERRPKRSTYVGLLLVTLSTLMYEIALTRIFSVTMWYHFAFVAISVALFGLTAGALLVHLLPDRFREVRLERHLWLFSLLFAVSIAVCGAIQLSIKVVPRLTFVGVLSVFATCVVVSIPFIFSGIVVCLALTRFPTRVNRLYATDLVGAGLGCVVLVVLFTWLDGPSLVVLIGAFAAAGGLAFAVGAGSRKGKRVGATTFVVLAGLALVNANLASNGDAPLRVRWAKEVSDRQHKYEKWNAFSRITVDGNTKTRARPFGFMSETLPDDLLANRLAMTIDSTAGTVLSGYSGDPSETDYLRYDLAYMAHGIRPDSDVLVVGVGGGRDVLAALEYEQRSVTGVEINGNILDAVNNRYGDFTGHLDRNPRVKFVNDEARSYIARTDRKYDIIQISLIDTWAATSAGAYALSENALYTTQAWDLFLDRLQPGGILSVSRWYELGGAPPLEAYRTAVLAAHALKDRGVDDPRSHILIYKSPPQFYGISGATIMVSRDPFSASDLDAIAADAERLQFTPVLTPAGALDPKFAAITARDGPGRAVDSTDEDISPPTDDRPYFFQMANLNTFLRGKGFGDVFVFRPVLVLGILGLTVLLLAAICIALPLILEKRKGARRRGMLPFYTYFAGIGFAFLLIEVSQLQRLSIFLGHPTYALTVVLFTVLVFSGLGSMLTERLIRADRGTTLLKPLLALLAVVVAFGFVTPAVIARADGATTPTRIAIAVALLAPLALFMGMPFAIGMRAATSRPGTPTAFLWGINGATSVCASVLAVVLALFFGISTAFWAGALAYAVAFASMIAITAPLRAPPAPEPVRVPREVEPVEV
jgi:MFS family permease